MRVEGCLLNSEVTLFLVLLKSGPVLESFPEASLIPRIFGFFSAARSPFLLWGTAVLEVWKCSCLLIPKTCLPFWLPDYVVVVW